MQAAEALHLWPQGILWKPQRKPRQRGETRRDTEKNGTTE
jgi:hypothetical protein